MLYNLALIDCKAERFISQTLQGIKLFGATMYILTELEGRTGKTFGSRSRRTGTFFFPITFQRNSAWGRTSHEKIAYLSYVSFVLSHSSHV